MEYLNHNSVLLNEVTAFFAPVIELQKNSPWISDLTFGRGGHSFYLLEKYPDLKILAFDQDVEAIENGLTMIKNKGFEKKLFLCHSNFESFANKYLDFLNKKNQVPPSQGFQCILLDLGISSHQVDSSERGLSFRHEARLDMRMNQDNNSVSAWDLVNDSSEQELKEIFEKFGEEKFSRRIAKNIVEQRKKAPINSTLDLENIIFHSYPSTKRHSRIHPATKCFQALRIAVNRELEVLENALPDLFSLLSPGGRLAIISFHSLEDRIVKHTFKNLQKSSPDKFKILTKKPIVPKDEEIKINYRARSAKLRVLEKISI